MRVRGLAPAVAALLVILAACGGATITPGPTEPTGSAATAAASGTSPTSSTVPFPSAVPSPAATAIAAGCSLPLTHDPYTGYHAAVPDGWDVSTLNGEIVVENGPTATEAVEFYPALASAGVTAQQFFDTVIAFKSRQLKAGGHPITVTPMAPVAGLPVDAISGTQGTTAVSGIATVAQVPLAAQHATSELVYEAYWAPASAFPAEQRRLAAIAGCYGPEPGAIFRVFQDQVFTYSMPPGWSVTDETQNRLDLALGSEADVSYSFLEVMQASQVGSSQALVRFFLGQEQFTGVTALWSASSAPAAESNGGTGTVTYEEYTATHGGLPDHGLIYAQLSVGGGISSGTVRIAVSTAATWNALNASMIQMAFFIEHNFTQDLQQIQQVNRQLQDFAGQVSNFDDVLNSQQLVQDPTTGGLYEAPYSSYQVDGPAGPGYYLPNGQLLNAVQRP